MDDDYTIEFFGWCSEDGHDKVWGYVTIGDRLYNFWGRRGKKFTFKQEDNTSFQNSKYARKAEQKCRSGRSSGAYTAISPSRVEDVWPDFHEVFGRQLLFAKLSDGFFNHVD